eukprot:2417755-Pyramimonas_sp.AAC.1
MREATVLHLHELAQAEDLQPCRDAAAAIWRGGQEVADEFGRLPGPARPPRYYYDDTDYVEAVPQLARDAHSLGLGACTSQSVTSSGSSASAMASTGATGSTRAP